MRIIAGKFKGRKLVDSSKCKDLRPTTDKNREALFNILTSAKFLRAENFSLANSVFLDLCCGTGSVGLEAISRGAKKVVFIDNNPLHLEIVAKNIAILSPNPKDLNKLDLTSQDSNLQDFAYKIIKQDALNLQENIDDFDIIFLDPPYHQDYRKIVTNLLEKNYLRGHFNQSKKPNATLLIIEFDAKEAKKYQDFIEDKLINLDLRIYGKSLFGFYKIKNRDAFCS